MDAERLAARWALFDVLTIGFPFCAFKVIAGLALGGWGLALTALGLVDAAINAVNFGGLLIFGRRLTGACLLSVLSGAGRGERWRELGDSLDVLVAFVLVAWMIGAGRIGALPPAQLASWNACVILNVLGAGFGRVAHSMRRLSGPADA